MGTLTSLPYGVIVAWGVWLVGGLALLLWFRRRYSPAPAPARPAAASPVRLSGVRPPAVPPPAHLDYAEPEPTPQEDAFAELAALLDTPADHTTDAR
ncbi:MAG: hypothetical protein R2712_23520 [Vicinamibacterales bacterium]